MSRMIWVQAGGIPSAVQAARLLDTGQSSGELRLPWWGRMASASTSGTHDRLMDCTHPLFTLIDEENHFSCLIQQLLIFLFKFWELEKDTLDI